MDLIHWCIEWTKDAVHVSYLFVLQFETITFLLEETANNLYTELDIEIGPNGFAGPETHYIISIESYFHSKTD